MLSRANFHFSILIGVFKKRLQRENLDKDEATERAKRVNALINNKINNLRRGRVLNKQAKAKLNSTV